MEFLDPLEAEKFEKQKRKLFCWTHWTIRSQVFPNTEYYSFKKIYENRIPNSIRNLKIKE